MVKDGTVRASRTAAARVAAGLVVGQAWVVSDEEALLVPEWSGLGPLAAALVAALTFTWLLMRLRWRRDVAVPGPRRTACAAGELRPWGGSRGRRLSACAGTWRRRQALPHSRRRRSH